MENGASLCWNLLNSNVECASKLLTGRKNDEGIHVPAPFLQWSRIAQHVLTLWHSSLPPSSYKHPTPQCQRRPGVQNRRHADRQSWGALRLYVYRKLVVTTMAGLKHGWRRSDTRHRNCPIQSCLYQKATVRQWDCNLEVRGPKAEYPYLCIELFPEFSELLKISWS